MSNQNHRTALFSTFLSFSIYSCWVRAIFLVRKRIRVIRLRTLSRSVVFLYTARSDSVHSASSSVPRVRVKRLGGPRLAECLPGHRFPGYIRRNLSPGRPFAARGTAGTDLTGFRIDFYTRLERLYRRVVSELCVSLYLKRVSWNTVRRQKCTGQHLRAVG